MNLREKEIKLEWLQVKKREIRKIISHVIEYAIIWTHIYVIAMENGELCF